MASPDLREDLFATLRALSAAERACQQARSQIASALRTPTVMERLGVEPPAGADLAARRERLGLTQRDLAEVTCISRATIAQVESKPHLRLSTTRRYLALVLSQLEAAR